MLNLTLTPPFDSKIEAFNGFACGYDSGGRGIDVLARLAHLEQNLQNQGLDSKTTISKMETVQKRTVEWGQVRASITYLI